MAGLIIVLFVALFVAFNIVQGYRGRGELTTRKALRARRRRSLWASGAGDTSASGGYGCSGGQGGHGSGCGGGHGCGGGGCGGGGCGGGSS